MIENNDKNNIICYILKNKNTIFQRELYVPLFFFRGDLCPRGPGPYSFL